MADRGNKTLADRMSNLAPAALAGGAAAGPTAQPVPVPPPPAVTPVPPIRSDSDIATWPQVPSEVSAKVHALRRVRDDARTLLRTVRDEQDAARAGKRDANARLVAIAGPKERRWFDPPTIPPIADDHPELVSVRRRIEVAEVDIRRLDDLVAVRSHRLNQVGRLVTRIEEYFGEHLRRLASIPLHDGAPPELRRGEDAVAVLERCRHRIRVLDADAHAIRSAPWPAGEAKRRAISEIEKLAQRGAPNVSAMIESPDKGIGWQRPISDVTVAGRLVVLQGEPSPSLWFWVWRRELTEAIEQEIDRVSDDENALDERQRAEKMTVILADKLETERQEEHWITEAIAGGSPLLRRPDADPRAVLALADNLPPP